MQSYAQLTGDSEWQLTGQSHCACAEVCACAWFLGCQLVAFLHIFRLLASVNNLIYAVRKRKKAEVKTWPETKPLAMFCATQELDAEYRAAFDAVLQHFFLFHTFSYACVSNCSSAIVSAVTAMFWPAHRAQRVRFETLADCCSCESILFRCHCIWPPLLWIMQESPGF